MFDEANENACDEAFAAFLRAGGPEVEAALTQRFGRGLLCMLMKRTGDKALAEDLLQETFLVVLKKLRNGDVQQLEKIRAYLYQVARNLVIADYRKNKRLVQGVETLNPQDSAMSAEAAMERNERVDKVRRVISELRRARDREVLFRFYVAEEDRRQICAEMGLDSVQLTKVLCRARNRFQQLWQKAGTKLIGGI